MASTDFSTPTGITRTGKLVRTRIELCSTDELIHIRSQLGDGQLKEFKRKYGDILDLLDISIPADAIKVLSHYWDNQLRCFVFPHCHLSLVLEEYASIMRMPIHEQTPIYSYPNYLPSRNQIAGLLELPEEQLASVKPGKTEVIPLKFLLKYMSKLSKEKNWPLFNKVLALTVYGTILFPSAEGAIDSSAISVFMAVEYQKANPVPAILADTIMTLTYCLRKGGGKLRCCLQLLTVWMGNHVFGKEWQRGVRLDRTHHPLRDFVAREGGMFRKPSKRGADATYKFWVALFNELTSQDVRWKLAWWDQEEVLFSCGDFHNVPLVSAKGGINYNPALALKQLAYEQSVPAGEIIRPFYFLHGSQSTEQNNRITNAWGLMHFKGRLELGARKVFATPEFELWMHGQESQRQPPMTPSPNPLMGRKDDKMKEALNAVIAQQKEQIENLVAEKKWQKREIRKNEEEYVQLHRDIRGLKRRSNPARASQEENMEQEIKRLKAEAAASKRKEHDVRQKWAAERRKNGELQSKLELEKKKTIEAQSEGKELAAHLEQEKGASDILQKEIEEICKLK